MEKADPAAPAQPAAPVAQPKAEPIILGDVPDIEGFVHSIAADGKSVSLMNRGLAFSDDPTFHSLMEHTAKLFFSKANIPAEIVNRFLILVSPKDKSARMYVNSKLPIQFHLNVKRDIHVNTPLYLDDLALVHEIIFPGVEIKEGEILLVGLRVNYKFVFLFDMQRKKPDQDTWDLPTIQKRLAFAYREMAFENVFTLEKQPDLVNALYEDGWFPFIEILGSNFDDLFLIYRDNPAAKDAASKNVVDSFTPERVNQIASRWWRIPEFLGKKALLEAGVSTFNRNTEADTIAAIKILVSEIDGILHLKYYHDTTNDETKSAPRIQYLKSLGEVKFPTVGTSLLPQLFADYMQKVVFPKFNLPAGKLDLSRHTSSHGLAEAVAYTRVRALQLILILDQIAWYS